MSHVEYVDAMTDIKILNLAEGAKKKIVYGGKVMNTNKIIGNEFVNVEHVVQGKKHILRAFTANGRLIGVHTYGDGQSMHSSYDKALEALKKRISDHIYAIAKNSGVKTSGLY